MSNKNYNITDPDILASLEVFLEKMRECGYAEATARGYVGMAAAYIDTGLPMTIEAIEQYYDGLLKTIGQDKKKRARLYTKKAGTMRYYDCFYGSGLASDGKNGQTNRLGTGKKCNEDCFNCIYPDCIFD